LGKWVLRYLFDNLIDEEIKRDETFRKQLLDSKRQSIERPRPQSNIQIPSNNITNWKDAASGPASSTTLRPTNGFHLPPHTPGLAIGLATPGPLQQTVSQTTTLSPSAEEGHPAVYSPNHPRTSSERASSDYFSSHTFSGTPVLPGVTVTNGQSSASNEQIPSSDTTSQSPLAERTDSQEKTAEDHKKGMFGSKKFRGLGFGMKSLKRDKTNEAAIAKPAPVNETPSEDSDSRSSKTEDRIIEDNFLGVIQRMRHGYEEQLHHPHPQKDGEEPSLRLDSTISPSLPNDTPVLKPPTNTTILIQEDRVDSGGVADLFEGRVGSLGQQADLIEKVAPIWLAECLLRNHIPAKDIVKVSFILEPLADALPSIASDGYVFIQLIFSSFPTQYSLVYHHSKASKWESTLTSLQKHPPQREPHAPRPENPSLRR
jgi:WD repeat-containing protein 48